MIKDFRHKGLKNFFETGSLKGIMPEHAKRLRLILAQLDVAESLDDMNLPGLHLLKGDLSGVWAVTVSGNWRVCFRFENQNAVAVNYGDYH